MPFAVSSRLAAAARGASLGLAALFALSLAPPAAEAQQAPGKRTIERLDATDLPGFDYDILRGVSLDDCANACIADGVCRAYTYNLKAGWCFLKSDVGAPKTFSGAASGRIQVAAAARPAAVPLPLPDLSFLPSDVITEASRFRARAAAAARLNRALDPLSYAETAGLAAGGAPDWLAVAARLVSRTDNDWSTNYTIEQAALSASYLSLTLASTPDEQADALQLLGRALERREIWRPAIESLKASLAIVDDPVVRTVYEQVREEHGFRILDYSVDSDAAAPRMCVQFSEPLAKDRTDFSKYITVLGQRSPVVTANGNELCVDGLTHGERYEVTLRAGVPSTVEEKLENPASYTIYVRDRKPSVRFPSAAYVLPRTGATGVPVVSVNTADVKLDLLRVGDRALARSVGDGSFRRQLQPYEVDELASTNGALVWSGTMPVERVLNQEVTTAFPVDEAVAKLEPGVYVLAARAEEEPSWSGNTRATQWFIVSDLGLASFSGTGGTHAFVRSLATAKPIEGAEVRLVARNDEVLGTARTDASGHAVFPAGATAGRGGMAPTVLTAATGDGDYAFLDLTAASFDLADRGVDGRTAPGPLDAFVYTERGVYRAGETVYATALLRNARADAVASVPLTLVVSRPDGVEYARATTADGGLGGRTLPVDLVPAAMTGTWRIDAYADPKAPPIGQTTFLVEDFIPERIDLVFQTDTPAIGPNDPAMLTVDARFLYGAPAADLALEGDIVIAPATQVEGYAGYRFGLADDPVTPLRRPLLELPRTGADGKAEVTVRLPELEPTTKPLDAKIILRVREAGGRAVERSLSLPVKPTGTRIGVKPQFDGGRIGEGETAGFEIVAVDPAGARTSLPGVSWELLKVERRYQWYNRDGRWSFETISSTSRVDGGKVDLIPGAPVRVAAPVEWGTYRLEVIAESDPQAASSVDFAAGWASVGATADTPDLLELSLDKPGYAPGETANLRITPQFPGVALIAVVGDGLIDMKPVEVPAEGITVPLSVGDGWSPGAYVTATLYRPMDVSAGRMPTRALGLSWLGVGRAQRTLTVNLDAPAEVKPRGALTVPLTLTGLSPGDEAFVTVAAVDVGILNLTGYEPPDAAEYYLGQRRLSAEIRDLYGSLIDSLSATRGRLRTGGDGGGGSTEAAPPAQEIVSKFSGILKVGPDGKAVATFELPAFNGTVKVMAVAWAAGKVGNASADVIVRDPVVVTATAPRFLAPGDESRLRLDFANVAGASGDYTLAVSSEGFVGVGDSDTKVALPAGGKAGLDVPLTGAGIGADTLEIALTAPDGETFAQTLRIGVRPASSPVTQRSLDPLTAGGTLSIGPEVLDGFDTRTATVSVTVADTAGIDVPGLVAMLSRYPYGCAEQTTSKALPLLYLETVAASVGLGTDKEVKERVQAAIDRLLQFQSSSGSFGLWGPEGGDLWLTAYVTDFLTRAKAQGYAVPDAVLSQALDRMQNDLSYASNFQAGEGLDVAYALYVLARNGRASIADLRYFADDRINDFGSGLAKAQIAAGLAFYGDQPRAAATFKVAARSLGDEHGIALSRTDFGTGLRDAAATVALIAESGLDRQAVPGVLRVIEDDISADTFPSTQEAAWMVVAANALIDGKASGLSLEVDGLPHTGVLYRKMTAAAVENAPLEIVNRGNETTLAAITTEGLPLSPLPEGSNGLTLERQYFSLDGEEVDVATVAQNDRFVVVLTLTALEPSQARLLVVDMLPAGFEIENPALMTSGDLVAFPWLTTDNWPAHSEFRDDRFVAAYEPGADATAGLTVAYMVRAVSPGSFAHPGASAEDMYRPGTYARTAPGTLTVTPPR
jgi:uncharacterized protein YfaS (alpha-2-macroglobulin family)